MTEPVDRPLTVTEITNDIRFLLEETFARVWVVGEVSNLRRPGSGHLYLTLKDDGAQIAGVVWRSTVARLRTQPENGMQVAVRGRVAVYAPRGGYQIVIDGLQPFGLGALEEAFRRLCTKLEAEGLFDPARKRPLPFLPRRIAIVTSPSGAALPDVVNVITRRFPPADLLVVPTRVQGEGAAAEIARAIARLNADPRGCEVVIVTRGGGSLEDLWAFNEEAVARAIAASRLPVISAVGHEIDVTVADLVADRRALTPSEAGEIVLPRLDQLLATVADAGGRLRRAGERSIDRSRRGLHELRRRLLGRAPARAIADRSQRTDELAERATRAARAAAARARAALGAAAGRLDALSPLRVLGRGYGITTREGERAPLRDVAGLATGDRISTRLARGTILSDVVGTNDDE